MLLDGGRFEFVVMGEIDCIPPLHAQQCLRLPVPQAERILVRLFREQRQKWRLGLLLFLDLCSMRHLCRRSARQGFVF